jgi:hypothetical protein
MAEFDMTRRYGIYPPSRYSASGPLAVNGAQLIVSGTAQHGPVGISRLDSFTFLNLPVSTDEAEHVRAAQLEIYPAPARSLTTIRLTLPAPSQVRIVVVDMLGRTVLSVADHETPAGTHTVPLDVSRLAPGAYVVVAETGTTRQTARLSVVR